MRERLRERPIIFSAPMVRALLEGRKTQARMIVNTPTPRDEVWIDEKTGLYFTNIGHAFGNSTALRNPHGRPGDRLWVRERLNILDWDESDSRCGACVQYAADGCVRGWTHDEEEKVDLAWGAGKKIISSGHMPRWASRITLELTGVRVERLQDISEEDAASEGVERHIVRPGKFSSHLDAFVVLWGVMYGDVATWKSNPWVWVLQFQRINAEPWTAQQCLTKGTTSPEANK